MRANIKLNEAIESFKEQNKQLALSYMNDKGNLPMIVTFLTQNGDNDFAIIASPEIGIYSAEDKPRFIYNVKSAIQSLKPVALAFLTEAWVVKRPIDQPIDFGIKPSQLPDKEEKVIVQIETYLEDSMYVYDIIHHSSGQIELVFDEESSNDHIDKSKSHGTFSNLLKENYDKFYKEIEESINKNQN